MKHYLLTLFLFVFFINSSLLGRSKTETTKNTPSEQYKHKITPSPIDGFLENKGQLADSDGNPVDFVLFKIEAPGVDFYLTDEGATYVFKKIRKEPIPEEEWSEADKMKAQMGKKATKKHVDWERIDLVLQGASIKKENIIKEYPSKQGHLNFFYPHCPDGIYGVKEYGKITIKEVYPGIDWVFYNSNDQGYKYDFIVHSGANPDDIELIYRSKNKLHINKNGALEINTAYGQLKEEAPKTYLNHQLVNCSFHLEQVQKNDQLGYDNLITFNISKTVKNKLQETGNTLIIDPQLVWATFYGGNNLDGPQCIKTDGNNNLFVVGYVFGVNFPTQDNGTFFQGTISGVNLDNFILKFDNNGNRIWATFYGGSGIDSPSSLTIDRNSNVLLTGSTNSTNFPTQTNGTFFQGTFAGGTADVFILKFDNNGNRLWATYYGGSGSEGGSAINIDGNNDIFVAGVTSSTNFPTQTNGTFFQGTNAGIFDAYILKFDNNGNRLWATYYGGDGNDGVNSINLDGNNNIFLTGFTVSSNFPSQNNSSYFQGTLAGTGMHVFISKLNNNGSLLWSTYYGGSIGNALGNSLVIDRNNNVYVTGWVTSPNFPTLNNGTFFQGTLAGGGGDVDGFILKFDNNGNRLWATYYGGNETENTFLATIDLCDNIYFSFRTRSTDLITQSFCNGGYFQNTLNGSSDAFICKFSNNGSLLGASYFGGDGYDFSTAITSDQLNNIWLTGEWTNPSILSSYPLVNPGSGAWYDNTFNGGSDDAFIAKFSTNPIITTTSTNSSCNCDGTATVSISNLCPPYDYIWDNGSQTLAVTDTFNTITNLCAGTYNITVIGNCDTVTANINVTSSGNGIAIDTTTITSCDSALVNNNWYYTSQTVIDTFLNAASNGCDSILVTNLIINQAVIDTINTSFCDSALINSTWYYSSQTITDTLPNAATNGCDSILVTNLTINQSTIDTINASFCDSALINNNWYYTSQTINDTFPNAAPNGCDSILVTNLTINQSAIDTINASFCDSALVNNNWYYTSQTITDTFPNAASNGCDSILVTNLTINQSAIDTINTSFCDSALINNTWYYTSQTITDIFPNAASNGCDSILVTNLIINQAAIDTINTSFCDSALINNTWYYTSQTITDTFPNAASNGCDSILTSNVIIASSPTLTITPIFDTIDLGQSIALIASGATNYTWFNDYSTDSILTISPIETTSYCVEGTNLTACKDTLCATIFVKKLAGNIYVPNTFTPNGDGINDVFFVKGINITEFQLEIYNRWGELLFETTDMKEAWDGTYQGNSVQDGIYIWKLKVTTLDEEVYEHVGHVNLLK